MVALLTYTKAKKELLKKAIDCIVMPQIASNAISGDALVPTTTLGVLDNAATSNYLKALMIHKLD